MTENAKEKIRRTLVDLSDRMSIEKISVSTLIKACNISRSLFYYYYHDIFEVMEDLLDTETEKIIRSSISADNPYDTMKRYVYDMADRFSLLSKLKGTRYYEIAERKVLEANKKILTAGMHKRIGDVEISFEYVGFLLDYMAAGFTGYFFEHCTDDPFDRESCARYFYRIIARELGLPEVYKN